jgi:magnesium and cobalt transporter
LDEGSDSRFWPFLSRIFRSKNEAPLEDAILEAVEGGELKAEEMGMLLNILRLGQQKVYEILVPRPDVEFAEDDSTIREIADLMISSGHSRIPIYHDNRDQIVGIIHAKDLLKSLLEPENRAEEVTSLMRKPFFVPETKSVKEVLQEFRAKQIHLAITLDEYGGTSGLVTLEDVLEEIVGEIQDEYDVERPEDIRMLDENDALVSGRTSLEDLAERMNLKLESDEVETLGGYLSELAGRVPEAGEQFSLAGHRFTIKDADAKQIRLVHISSLK